MSYKLLVDILGWLGSIEVVLAYALISAKKMSPNSKIYQWLNISGALFLIANTLFYGAFPSATVNVIWVVIGWVALVKIYFPNQLTTED
ncbi:MAG: hypothetical protein HQ474_10430 [Flammeovirgaceae bacterium]|jgi:hypothetical protein|nr:hypothetical protein [Flammeovirgaceae bacterium]